MFSFIRRHEGWLNYIIFSSSTVVLFIYTPFSVVQRLAQSVFFNFLGPGAGAAANLTISTLGGAVTVVGAKGVGSVVMYLYDHGQLRQIYPALAPAPLAVLPPAGVTAPAMPPAARRGEYSPVSPIDGDDVERRTEHSL